MGYSIQGKCALVTGSTAGLGRELAFQLCCAGARVMINGRDQQRLENAAEEFRKHGYEVEFVQGDVSDAEECTRIIKYCVERFGTIDILINNAGIGSAGTFLDTSPDIFRKVFELNTLGTIYMTRLALPYILQSRGSIIFISSLAGLVGLPFSSLYSGTKMALTAIGQGLRFELKGSGVHIGIAYAGFLKNGPEKRVLGPDGKLQHTGDRTGYRLQSMEKASAIIIRMIRKRQGTKVMSAMGKGLYIAVRFAPWALRILLENTLERARKSYEPVPKS